MDVGQEIPVGTEASRDRGERSDGPAAPAPRENLLTQAVLVDPKGSVLAKYQRLVTGGQGLWYLVKYELIIGLFSGVPGLAGMALRQFLYRFLFKRLGKGVAIGRHVTFRHPNRIEIGNRVVIEDEAVLDAKGEVGEGIILGDEVFIGRGTILASRHDTLRIGKGSNISSLCRIGPSRIGEKVLIAAYVYVIGGGHHSERTDFPIIDQPVAFYGGADIEDGCWIGAFTAVLDGVRIGHDSIIGAHSLVSRDLPPYSVAFGAPAQFQRSRLESDQTPG